MINQQYDVAIVGAGPCGSIFAYELARKGVRVLVLEKEKLPRAKVCAGGITFRASTLIPFDFSTVIENVIYGANLSYNLRSEIIRKYDKPLAYMVMRDKFDYFLASQARQAGATIREGVEVLGVDSQKNGVRITTSQDSLSVPLLVGADGANSIVARNLGIKNGFDYGVGVSSLINADDSKLQDWNGLIGLDWGIPGGYAWVFPKRSYFSVGAGGGMRVARNLKPYTLRLIKEFKLSATDGHVVRGHLMPLRKAGTPLHYGSILLTGDAAGVVDPLSGEGIFYGLKSVYLALPAVIHYLEGKAVDLSEYSRAVDNELMPELKASRSIQRLNSATPRIFYHYLKENDRFWRAFCRMLRGEKTYLSLKASLPAPLRTLFRIF